MIQVKSNAPKDIDKAMVSVVRQVKKRRDGEIISEADLNITICLACADNLKEGGWNILADGTLELVDGTTIEKDGVSYICEGGKWEAVDS